MKLTLRFHNAVSLKLISPANYNYLHLFHLFMYVVIFVAVVKLSYTAWY